MGRPKLSEKRRRFVEAYKGSAAGNATEAARIAGYAHPGQQGHRLLKDVHVADALKKFSEKVRSAAIADAAECQKILTEIARGDTAAEDKDRISAADKLLKTHGAYTEKREVEHKGASVSFVFEDNGRGPRK